jgi:hypothetical protein
MWVRRFRSLKLVLKSLRTLIFSDCHTDSVVLNQLQRLSARNSRSRVSVHRYFSSSLDPQKGSFWHKESGLSKVCTLLVEKKAKKV